MTEWAAAQETAKTKTSERNDAFDALCAGLSQLAGYVEAASGGDAAKILSAGMDVRADRTPPSVPPQATNLVLTAGDFPGTLDAMCDSQGPTAKSYEWQVSPDPMTESGWATKLTTTKSSATLPGLTSATKVWVRVRALGAAGPGPWSDPATKTVP